MDDVLAVLAAALERANLAHALIGGHAVNAWLEPRFTADIDLTVAVDAGGLSCLGRELGAAGFSCAVEHGAALPSGPDFVRFVSADGSARIELQPAKTAFQREAIERAGVAGMGLRVATPEDLIVMKLIANRPKDQVDLAGLLRLPALDWSYVDRWAREWGVEEELRRAMARASSGD